MWLTDFVKCFNLDSLCTQYYCMLFCVCLMHNAIHCITINYNEIVIGTNYTKLMYEIK